MIKKISTIKEFNENQSKTINANTIGRNKNEMSIYTQKRVSRNISNSKNDSPDNKNNSRKNFYFSSEQKYLIRKREDAKSEFDKSRKENHNNELSPNSSSNFLYENMNDKLFKIKA
mgnify:CR=1 FL=1